MGEAAGIAASHAVKSGKNVQDVDGEAMRADMKSSGVKMEWNGKGYGPGSGKHWPADAIYWRLNPDDYKKIPIRLDPGWTAESSDEKE